MGSIPNFCPHPAWGSCNPELPPERPPLRQRKTKGAHAWNVEVRRAERTERTGCGATRGPRRDVVVPLKAFHVEMGAPCTADPLVPCSRAVGVFVQHVPNIQTVSHGHRRSPESRGTQIYPLRAAGWLGTHPVPSYSQVGNLARSGGKPYFLSRFHSSLWRQS